MGDDILHKFRQVSEIYRQKLKSKAAEDRNEQYVRALYAELQQWMAQADAQIKDMVDRKREDIRQRYDDYCGEIDGKYAALSEEIDNGDRSADLDDQIEAFNTFCQSNTLQKRLHLNTSPLTREELKDKIHIEYLPYRDVPHEPNLIILTRLPREEQRAGENVPTSTTIGGTHPERGKFGTDEADHDKINYSVHDHDDLESTMIRISLRTSTEIDPLPISIIGSHETVKEIPTPVLVDKNRVVKIPTIDGTEYSIDALFLPRSADQHLVSLNTSPHRIVHQTDIIEEYKAFLESETRHLAQSSLASDDELNSNLHHPFHLRHFDQVAYSTVMFKHCETEFNCISSSTRRNELLVYNSKLKVLIILQHEVQRHCRQRFYMKWIEQLSPHVSDITYSHSSDQFLLSTLDTSHIYAFNRDLLTVTDFGQVSKDLPLRRIHCHRETLYCILENNYLLEYELDHRNSRIQFIQRIKVSNPSNPSVDAAYPLFDVTCNERNLLVVYGNGRDEIRLQMLDRRSLTISDDILLDERDRIERRFIRIESTPVDGHFIYLNGLHRRLKSVDLSRQQHGKITSVMQRHTKPTNACLLQDGRLVILYEQPYFLSVHRAEQPRSN